MNIVIDVGNTFSKVGIFENDSLRKKEVFGDADAVRHYLERTPADNLLISSVAGDGEKISAWSIATRKLILHHALRFPIQNKYGTPATLGVDRLAAACGAWRLFKKENSLVIDVGTCINYEFINREGHYLGGAISPGVKMRFEAMHHFTAKLPLVSPKDGVPLIGNSTTDCLQSGVMNGTLEEIKGTIDRYQIEHPGINVILCGGDTHFFENHLKPSIFVAPDLVLMGLNSILLHNVNS